MRLCSVIGLVCLAACASKAPEAPPLETSFVFTPDDRSSLVMVDVTSIGDIDRDLTFRFVDLDGRQFKEWSRPGLVVTKEKVVTTTDDPITFAAEETRAGYLAFLAIAPQPGTAHPVFRRRTPVYELAPGDVGIFSLHSAGVDPLGDDVRERIEQAATQALVRYPGISGTPKILEPIAYIDTLQVGPGFEDFAVVEDRRPAPAKTIQLSSTQ